MKSINHITNSSLKKNRSYLIQWKNLRSISWKKLKSLETIYKLRKININMPKIKKFGLKNE